MSLLTDESLVRFSDREELVNHVRRRGAAMRRRSQLARAAGMLVVIGLLVGPPAVRLMDSSESAVRTVPAAERPDATKDMSVEPGTPVIEDSAPAQVGGQASSGRAGAGSPMPGDRPESQPAAPPTTVPPPLAPEAEDECSVKEVSAGATAAGDGPTCQFTAVKPGGYEAAGDWQITIYRGEEIIIYASRDGSAGCGATGTIQPGDHVEVRVKVGMAGAGRSYGADCS